MELKGSIALVTGGSSGLGKATAKLLKEHGAEVIITGRDGEKVQQVAQELNVMGVQSDVANDEDIEKLFATIQEKYGKLDILINNAGIASAEWPEVDQLTREALKEVYEVNVFGAAVMGAHAAKLFKAQKSGNIVNIASTAALKGFAHGSIYSSSKFALRGMTQCWQAELRPYNVRVMLVNPSEVPTAFNRQDRVEREDEANKLSSEEIAHTIISNLLMKNRGFIPEVTVWATNPF